MSEIVVKRGLELWGLQQVLFYDYDYVLDTFH